MTERARVRVCARLCRTEKVACEHDILVALQEQTLSFKVPRPMPALGDGATYKLLSSGAAACVFDVIPGALRAMMGCSRGDLGCCTAAAVPQRMLLLAKVPRISGLQQQLHPGAYIP